jgi:YVTN family beta-propeller protein
VYIANSNDDNVFVIDSQTNVITDTIIVGNGPNGLSVSPDGSVLYCINQGAQNISVINTISLSVTSTITAGLIPVGFGNFISSYPNITVGYEDSSNQFFSSTLSPNPFANNTLISFNTNIPNGYLIVFDSFGRKVKELSFKGSNYLFEKESLSAGIYFIQIYNGDELIETKKIIIE